MSAEHTELTNAELEPSVSFVLRPSMHEILADSQLVHEAFDLDDISQERVIAQVRERQQLAEYVNHFIDALPSPEITIDRAVEQGFVSSAEAATFYRMLDEFLRDPRSARALLYMPFEWLPDIQYASDDKTLDLARTQFLDTYVDTWWSLLREHDVRAHFDDGDMRLDIDANTDELARVIKAAHLIPFLLVRGVITEDDVTYIHGGTNSEVLRQSINDAMMVYRHLHESLSQEKTKPTEGVTPEAIRRYYEQQLHVAHTEREAHASPQRLEWLEKVAFETTVQDMAARLNLETASALLVSGDELLESTACIALGRIATMAEEPEARAEALSTLLEQGSTSMKYYSMTLLRLYRGGYIPEDELTARGVKVPNLHGELSKNLDHGGEEMKVVRDYIDTVRNDPELSEMLYPVALIGGSRLKGYGDEHSDVDVTICIKPGVDVRKRQELFDRVLPLLGGDKPHEFWLQEKDDYLTVMTMDIEDQFVGNDYWVHVLFGGAWVGDDKTIAELRHRLYPPYFVEQYLEGTAMPLRPAHLGRIEDDVLLYRLLHRGYAHHFPARSLHVPHAERIDGNGVFYDAGYRQLASRLFIEKVFLPTL